MVPRPGGSLRPTGWRSFQRLPEPEADHRYDEQQGPQADHQGKDHILGIQYQPLQKAGKRQGDEIKDRIESLPHQKYEKEPEIPFQIPVEHIALSHGVGVKFLGLRFSRR